jgi:hypothetical protein
MRYLLVWIAWSAWGQNDAMRAALDKQRAAAEIQREAVRKQADLAGPRPLQRRLTPPEPDGKDSTQPAPPQTPTPKPTGN